MAMLRLHVNLEHPQPRHVRRAAQIARSGGLLIYPTDTTYGLGCDLYAKRAVERIYKVKGLSRKHPLSFICADLSEVAHYAIIEDWHYRILRHLLPGQYTFILPAGREVPRIVQSKVQTVGIRIPASPVSVALVKELGHPLISTTVPHLREEETAYVNDPDDAAALYRHSVEVLLDAGVLYGGPSSVVDLSGEAPRILRRGFGDLSYFE